MRNLDLLITSTNFVYQYMREVGARENIQNNMILPTWIC